MACTGSSQTDILINMNLLSVSKISRSGREKPLFTDVTFGLEEGEKVALIGRNGCGKSTLLSCITGELECETGSVVLNRAAGVSYLSQNPSFHSGDSIRDHIFTGAGAELKLIREYELVCEKITDTPALQSRLEELTHEMDVRNLWNWEARIKSILGVLGISDLSALMGSLSGGMLKKVALAQVLIEDTRLILLDEPTNHLDSTTIAWLEDYLRTTDRAVLMVTHDRYFLDAVCTSIYELEHGSLVRFKGNFTRYLELKADAEEIAARTDARIESVLRKEREWLLRGPQARGTKARARVDAVHRMINREKLTVETAFSFETTGRRLGGIILEAEGLTKAWPRPDGTPRTVINDFSFTFRKGQRLGVFGDNGTGKTTLLNLLAGELEADSGIRKAGSNTVFAYYRQNPVFPDTVETVLEYIRDQAEMIQMADGSVLTAALLLERFGFSGRIQYSSVHALSGGERKRLYLVRLLMSNPNFLILDEPTNDFDIYTLSILESFLVAYAGCLLIVSHDRYFMDRTVDTLLVLEQNGDISGFVGSCSEYIALRAERQSEAQTAVNSARVKSDSAVSAAAPAGPTDSSGSGSTAAGGSPKPKKLTYKEQKEFETMEGDIEALEKRKTELENLLSGGESDHRKLHELSVELEKAGQELDAKYHRWEHLASIAGA